MNLDMKIRRKGCFGKQGAEVNPNYSIKNIIFPKPLFMGIFGSMIMNIHIKINLDSN